MVYFLMLENHSVPSRCQLENWVRGEEEKEKNIEQLFSVKDFYKIEAVEIFSWISNEQGCQKPMANKANYEMIQGAK